MLCFFFQAEDGIRDIGVTGVQTCALPICSSRLSDRKARTTAPAAHRSSPTLSPCALLVSLLVDHIRDPAPKVSLAPHFPFTRRWGIIRGSEPMRPFYAYMWNEHI